MLFRILVFLFTLHFFYLSVNTTRAYSDFSIGDNGNNSVKTAFKKNFVNVLDEEFSEYEDSKKELTNSNFAFLSNDYLNYSFANYSYNLATTISYQIVFPPLFYGEINPPPPQTITVWTL